MIDLPKVLVIASTPFSKTKNNGKTLSSFFESYDRNKIAQFSYSDGDCNSDICDNYFFLTKENVLGGNKGEAYNSDNIPKDSNSIVHSAAPSGSWCGGQRQLSAANGSLVLGSRQGFNHHSIVLCCTFQDGIGGDLVIQNHGAPACRFHCEQIMVLRFISHRFSKISNRIFTSRSSVIVWSRKSSKMSRAAPQIFFRRFWYFE